ncbi:uncharacterized protein Dwil_GK13078 [Drosophila willistoni]|uniref:BRCA1-associated ATM activator 1 n=1 Tax=Drosophila willistoni TaxID=7260 RepID=B4NH52_DROWI|nr:uncharacterized protein LOC6651180 [Drosophila willistoni]EDW84549.1 uncharacterized protein Dwil_GK13078 [Drosophila willistoni]
MQKQEEILTRLKKIFEIFLHDNFTTTNNVYFEKLITHLQAEDNAFVMHAPFVIEWVDRCITLVTEDINKVHPKVISFMLNLASFLASNEWMLIKLRELDIMHRVVAFLQSNERHHFNPSIKLGGTRVMKAVSNYSMGLAFLRMQRAWTLLIQYSNNDHTLYVVREARKLLYEMLYKFCDKFHDQAVTLEILSEIMKPIHDNLYESTDNMERIHISVDDHDILHKISSTLDLLTYILQQSLVLEHRTKLIALLKEHHNLDFTLWKLSDMTHNTYFMEKILTSLSSYYFASLVHEKLLNPDATEPVEQFTEFGSSLFNVMKFCINRVDGLNFVKMAEINHLLWKKLGTRAPKEVMIENERVAIENQLICFHMLPLLFSMKYARILGEESKADLFDTYIMKLLEMSCEQTLRVCYNMRDAFFTPDGALNSHISPDLANKCIHSILSLKHVLDREQAVTVCQSLLYVLREVVALTSTNRMESDDCHSVSSTSSSYLDMYPRGTELVISDPKVLHSVMVGLRTLIEHFKITWKESVETIGLVNCLAFVLENTNMDARCTVQALKLVQLAVEHFLSPNMALLVDNLQGSALVCLGPIIVKRMHDTTWEVRDTTLELTTSIASISRSKFPAFQQFLIDAKIPPIVYEMAKNDSESYVRASAFKCLAKMVSINALWEHGLSQMDMVDHLLYVLYRENDDIVRTEAIVTLTMIYEHRKIPPKYKNTLFSTLNYCVVGDHHWEVKINALRFWKMEFQRQFENQGMIDGVFPTVTFSKEHKKIVTLTEKEVRLRIAKIFTEVQQYGYWGIVLKCLREEYAMEVLNVVVAGQKTFNQKMKKYEGLLNELALRSPQPQPSNDVDTSFSFNNETSSSSQEDSSIYNTPTPINTDQADEVIETILNSRDVQLLEKAFETQMHINDSETPVEKRHIDEFYYKQFAIPTSEWLTEVKKIDLEQLLKTQAEWAECKENFVSLLDDILIAIKRDDENLISDCY